MNKSENNNFETLKRALKLKRHEIPPPGYFNNFSSDVLDRIRAGESGGRETFAERLQTQAPWPIDFIRLFETKPGLIGAFAISACLVLVFGIVLAERPDAAPQDFMATAGGAANNQAATETVALTDPVLTPAGDSAGGIVASTNPVVSLQPATGLFGQQNPLFQSASFAPVGH